MNKYTKRILIANIIALSQLSLLQAEAYKDVKSIEEYNQIVTNGRPSIVYCYSPYCDACKTIEESFKSTAENQKNKANFIKVNLDNDALKPIGAKNEVKAVPTTLLKRSNGKTESSIRGSREQKEYDQEVASFLDNASHPAQPSNNNYGKSNAIRRPQNLRRKVMVP